MSDLKLVDTKGRYVWKLVNTYSRKFLTRKFQKNCDTRKFLKTGKTEMPGNWFSQKKCRKTGWCKPVKIIETGFCCLYKALIQFPTEFTCSNTLSLLIIKQYFPTIFWTRKLFSSHKIISLADSLKFHMVLISADLWKDHF